jgi:hypothetical protein
MSDNRQAEEVLASVTTNEPVWNPPPETVVWRLRKPLVRGTTTYTEISMRAPTVGEVMAVTSVRGMSNLETTLRLIEAVSEEKVPYEALQLVPAWVIDQIGRYMEAFTAAPMPYPLASAGAAPVS